MIVRGLLYGLRLLCGRRLRLRLILLCLVKCIWSWLRVSFRDDGPPIIEGLRHGRARMKRYPTRHCCNRNHSAEKSHDRPHAQMTLMDNANSLARVPAYAFTCRIKVNTYRRFERDVPMMLRSGAATAISLRRITSNQGGGRRSLRNAGL